VDVAERQFDGSETRVPLEPRHIAILFRRFVSFGEDLTRCVKAIEARHPHLLVGGKAFTGGRKWRRFGPRWRPSNGRTTSCRCSRR
jgi:hypothetical protein